MKIMLWYIAWMVQADLTNGGTESFKHAMLISYFMVLGVSIFIDVVQGRSAV